MVKPKKKGDKKGKKGKKGKKEKAPNKGPKIVVLEYLVDAGGRKEVRLVENQDGWVQDNVKLQSQVDSMQQELDATIAFLRRQEGEEKRTCTDTLAEQDSVLRNAEHDMEAEHGQQTRDIDDMTEELNDLNEEAEDVEKQVYYWRNYPNVQSAEKKTTMTQLKSDIRRVDELCDTFEEQLDGNFRYMQRHLTGQQAVRLERAKQAAASRRVKQLGLSDHSDLSAQDALCLQTVLLRAEAATVRDELDGIDGKNLSLKTKLVPMRQPERSRDAVAEQSNSGKTEESLLSPRHLHLESLTDLLASTRPSPEQVALVAQVRDTTLAALHPDEEELRARKLAARAAASARQSCTVAGSICGTGIPADSIAESAGSQLLPFEIPLRPSEESMTAQALQPFENFTPGPHWWRVHVPQPKPRTWPVTEPLLAEYAERPPVYDLAGPKVICESASVSSAHVSDEWRLGKAGREQHLQQRSTLSITPPESTPESTTGSGEEELTHTIKSDVSVKSGGSARSGTDVITAKSASHTSNTAKSGGDAHIAKSGSTAKSTAASEHSTTNTAKSDPSVPNKVKSDHSATSAPKSNHSAAAAASSIDDTAKVSSGIVAKGGKSIAATMKTSSIKDAAKVGSSSVTAVSSSQSKAATAAAAN